MDDQLALEYEHLALADRHITEGEARVSRQSELLKSLSRDSQPTAQAEQLLQLLSETLDTWRSHRRLIIDRIEALGGSP